MQNNSEQAKVLVVDDSRMMRVTIKKYLQFEFNVLEAGEGQQAWDILSEQPDIAVVVTDANMPVMDGFELIKKLRASRDDQLCAIPIIMITGAEEESVRELALETGATDFIVKPPERAQLLARVRSQVSATLENRALQEQSRTLAADATIDPKTQLTTRKFFMIHAEQAFAFAKRHEKPLSLVYILMDRRDAILKMHSPTMVDQMHLFIADQLKQITRREDSVTALDNGHYAILAPESGRDSVMVLCQRIQALLTGSRFQFENISMPVSVSQGLASLGEDTCGDVHAMLQLAQRRADIASANGGNQVVFEERQRQAKRIKAVTDITEALQLLKKGDKDRVRASLPILLYKLLPILELAAEHYKWKLQSLFMIIKKKYVAIARSSKDAQQRQSHSSK